MSSTASASPVAPVGHQGARVDITQRPALAVSGWFGVILLGICGYAVKVLLGDHPGWLWVPVLVFALVVTSLVIIPPGQTSVVQFFGTYVGTVRRPGFWWVLPLTIRRRVSVRVRNFETNRLKVNDSDGNPVDIAAIVVWQVADTATLDVRRGRLPGLRHGAGRVGAAARRHHASLRRRRGQRHLVARIDRPRRR